MVPQLAFRRWPVALAVSLAVAGCDTQAPLDPGLLARTTAATSLTATAYSHNRINLAWPDNAPNESGWEIHRSTTGPAGTFSLHTTTGANATRASDGGLQGTTEYCYQVRSFRVTGRHTTFGEFSNVACATTPAPPPPSGVNATPRYGYQIDLTWIDNSTDETGFRVERSAVSTGPWTVLATKYANATSHTDYVPQEQLFCYRVVALFGSSESAPSEVDCTALPAAPTGLAAAVSGGAVDLTWADNSAFEDGFEVERSVAWGPASVIANLPANAASYQDTGVPDGTYWYRVRATRDGGTGGSAFVQVVVATTAPNAPSDLHAVPQSSSSVAIWWVDGSTNEQGFRVERSTDGGATWQEWFTTGVDQTSAWDAVSPEVQVCYRVIAFNNVGDSPSSNAACARPLAAPTGFTATGVDTATIDFAWTDDSGSEDGYEIWAIECYWDYYYGSYCYLSWNVAALGPNTTTFRYAGGSSAYAWAYVVFATRNDADGRISSDFSNEAYPTPPPAGSDAERSEP
jgi:titin